MENNKVYTVLFENTLAAAGGGDGWEFNCPFWNHQAKLKSVTWNLRAYIAGPVNNLPLEVLDCLSYNLNIGAAADRLGTILDLVVVPGGGVVSQNGIRFSLFKPGQYLFDSCYIWNALNISAAFTNNHAVNQYHYQSQVVIELEYK